MPAAQAAYVAQVKYAWQHQADAVLSQVNPVQNTWYTVLVATDDVRIILASFDVAVANETIEFEITIDGLTLVVTQVAVFNTWYAACLRQWQADILDAESVWAVVAKPFFLEGQNVGIRVRKTTAAGAGNLNSIIKWARLLPT